ncbi:MAG: pyruvate, water dikinase [Actinomycetota bacterium]|nr:pyruvate, water dikinase [Actinomycetota bacterium]
MSYVVWFAEFQPEHAGQLGGKCASLGTMTVAGMPVPPGFAVTTDAYRFVHANPEIANAVHSLLGSFDPSNLGKLAAVSLELRNLVESAPVPTEVEDSVREGYAALAEMCGDPRVPVAVRSSATSEDLPDASFAGEHETYLWVQGPEAVLSMVRRCWSSLFTERAIAYRAQMKYPHDSVQMCVAVQKMVRPKAAGVAFTLNPRDGDRSQVAIDSSWGFGEAVVAGEVTPDNYLVDKVLYEITKRQVSSKEYEYRLGENGVERVAIVDERREQPSLDDAEIKAVARLARTAEKHYGCPQDVEWAVDLDLPDDANVLLLQSRPETVWSRRPVPSVATQGDYMASIVATLTSPLHAQSKSG